MDLARRPFDRHIDLPGWSPASRWGYDAVLECFWAELLADESDGAAVRIGAAQNGAVRIGAEHLIPTLTGLARAVAFAAEIGDGEVYLALTA